MASKNTSAPAAPSYGEVWPGQGGIVVDFVPSMGGKPGWYLIAPTTAAAEASALAWGSQGIDEPNAKDDWDGLANTIALADSKHEHPAAEWARGLVIDGHSDFYLPSRREMRLLWARTPELFKREWHWSSTQFSAESAWFQLFSLGHQYHIRQGLEGPLPSRPQIDHFLIQLFNLPARSAGR